MFGEALSLSYVWLCYVGPLVTLAVFGAMLCRPFGDLSLTMLCRPFGDLSNVWPCYVGPLVTLAVLGYIM